jgi:hypothetical protein
MTDKTIFTELSLTTAMQHERARLRQAARDAGGYEVIGLSVRKIGNTWSVRFSVFHHSNDNIHESVSVKASSQGRAFQAAHDALPTACEQVASELEAA